MLELKFGRLDERGAAKARKAPQSAIKTQQEFARERAARLARQAERAVHRAEIGMRDRVVGAKLRGLEVRLRGARRVSLREVGRPEIIVRLGEIGLEADRAPIGADRLVERAAVLQHVAQRPVEERDLAVRLDRLAQARFGMLELAAAVVRLAQ